MKPPKKEFVWTPFSGYNELEEFCEKASEYLEWREERNKKILNHLNNLQKLLEERIEICKRSREVD